MATIEDIKRLLESKDAKSARVLDDMEVQGETDNEVMEVPVGGDSYINGGKNDVAYLRVSGFVSAWNAMGKSIKMREGDTFPLACGETLLVKLRCGVNVTGALGLVDMIHSSILKGLVMVTGHVCDPTKSEIEVSVSNIGKEVKLISIGLSLAQLVLIPSMDYRFVGKTYKEEND